MTPDDEPGPDELRDFMRHPLTRRLNRELLECFERAARDPDPVPRSNDT